MTSTHRLTTEFGRRVRTLRASAGLSQAELAERAGISERTVSDLERGLRETVYPATARRLAAALGLTGAELASFFSEAQLKPLAPTYQAAANSQARRAPGIPVPLTRLLGRDDELVLVQELLTDRGARLVTLVGPGGIGKTRLGIEVALRLEERFAGGSFFVSLADTDDPSMVLPLIAAAVGLRALDGDNQHLLAERFGALKALLLMDTFEHLTGAASSVASLLAAAPGLSVLVTSRAPLSVRGEHEVQVPPLPIEPSTGGAHSPAIALFLERASSIKAGLDSSVSSIQIVADICRRTEGVPLAIELAAARVKQMTLPELRMQLEHRLEPLVGAARDLPARQRTMRRTYDWSYALLGAREMRLFRSLAPFRGGFLPEAAAAVVLPDDETPFHVSGALSGLLDSSLVLAETGNAEQQRYRLLETTREYAVERAVAAGEFEALRRRHAEFFLTLAERGEHELRGRDQHSWFSRLSQDEGNFRAALTWALEAGQGELALRLAGALWMFWRWQGLFSEGRAWLDSALESCTGCSLEVRFQGLWGAGWLAFHAGDYRRTEELGKEMLRLLGGRGDAIPRRNALTLVGSAALAEGRHQDALAAYRQALGAASAAGKTWHLATSMLNAGTAELQAGHREEARSLFEGALEIYEGLGDEHFTASVLVQLGYVDLFAGRPEEAARLIHRATELFASLRDGWAIAESLEAVSTLCSESHPIDAARLGGAAERLRASISMQQHPADARVSREFLERARKGLTAREFAAAWKEGEQMALEKALELARKLSS